MYYAFDRLLKRALLLDLNTKNYINIFFIENSYDYKYLHCFRRANEIYGRNCSKADQIRNSINDFDSTTRNKLPLQIGKLCKIQFYYARPKRIYISRSAVL